MSKQNNLKDFLADLYQGIVSKKPDASKNPQNFRSEVESIETAPEWDGSFTVTGEPTTDGGSGGSDDRDFYYLICSCIAEGNSMATNKLMGTEAIYRTIGSTETSKCDFFRPSSSNLMTCVKIPKNSEVKFRFYSKGSEFEYFKSDTLGLNMTNGTVGVESEWYTITQDIDDFICYAYGEYSGSGSSN